MMEPPESPARDAPVPSGSSCHPGPQTASFMAAGSPICAVARSYTGPWRQLPLQTRRAHAANSQREPEEQVKRDSRALCTVFCVSSLLSLLSWGSPPASLLCSWRSSDRSTAHVKVRSRHIAAMTDHAAEQEMELEALQAIYMDDLEGGCRAPGSV